MSIEIERVRGAERKAWRASRVEWMEIARTYATLWPTDFTRKRINECVDKARVASRHSWQGSNNYRS